jgi:hypothetical protein
MTERWLSVADEHLDRRTPKHLPKSTIGAGRGADSPVTCRVTSRPHAGPAKSETSFGHSPGKDEESHFLLRLI